MATHFYLARHGETFWNTEQRFQGQLNSLLTPLGEKQSHLLAQKFSAAQANHLLPVNHSVDAIISSPLKRAVDTAKICQQTLPVSLHIYEALKERDLGDWQGEQLPCLINQQNYTEIFQEITYAAPPNGESAIACALRMQQALLSISDEFPDKTLLVIVHGEALRCFINYQLIKNNNIYTEDLGKNAYELYKNTDIKLISVSHDKKVSIETMAF